MSHNSLKINGANIGKLLSPAFIHSVPAEYWKKGTLNADGSYTPMYSNGDVVEVHIGAKAAVLGKAKVISVADVPAGRYIESAAPNMSWGVDGPKAIKLINKHYQGFSMINIAIITFEWLPETINKEAYLQVAAWTLQRLNKDKLEGYVSIVLPVKQAADYQALTNAAIRLHGTNASPIDEATSIQQINILSIKNLAAAIANATQINKYAETIEPDEAATDGNTNTGASGDS